MKKLLLLLILISTPCFAGVNNIVEQDGSPSLYPWKIKVSNGTLTDNGDGSASLATGGASIGSAVSGATAKYLLYTDGSGNLAQDVTGKIGYVDDVNHSIGIGTTAPGTGLLYGALNTPLHVYSSSVAIAAVQAAGSALFYAESGTGNAILGLADTTAATNFKILDVLSSGGRMYSRRLTDAYSSALANGTVTDYVAADHNGCFGIATTDVTLGSTSTARLVVAAVDNSMTGIAVANMSNVPRFALNCLSSGGWTMYDYGNSGYTAGISQYKGNVGIGTTSPQTPLHIVTSGQDFRFAQTSGSGELRAGAAFYTGSPVGGFLSIVGDATGTAGGGTVINYYAGSGFNDFYSAAEILNTSSGLGNLLLMKSGGNVGIGTTAPTATLSIAEKLFVSSAGLVTKYNNIATVANGVPSELATINSTGLTANVGAATLYAVPSSGEGLYRVSAYVVETTAASVSSTLANVQIVYTDKDSNTSVTIDATPVLGVAGIGQTGALTANTVGTASSGVIVIYVKASTTIQYQTVNYASTAAGMTYALRIKLEAL